VNQPPVDSIDTICQRLVNRREATGISGCEGAAQACLIAGAFQRLHQCLLIVTATLKNAEVLARDLSFFCPQAETVVFPPYNLLPFKTIGYSTSLAARRISLLYRLATEPTPLIVVAPVDALMAMLPPRRQLTAAAELVLAGETLDREDLSARLVAAGYSPGVIVEEPGDFSIRGGIMDVFSPLYPHPLRIEFFGDLVDCLRFFDVTSQRKIADADEAVLVPAKEAIVPADGLNAIAGRIRSQAASQDLPITRVRDIVGRFKDRKAATDELEGLLNLFYAGLETLFDYLPDPVLIMVSEPAEVAQAGLAADQKRAAHHHGAQTQGRLCVDLHALFLSWSDLSGQIARRRPVGLKALGETVPGTRAGDHLHVQVTGTADLALQMGQRQGKANLLRPLAEWIRHHRQGGQRVIIAAGSTLQAERIASLLAPYQLKVTTIGQIGAATAEDVDAWICVGQVSAGFVWNAEGLALVRENEIFGGSHRRRGKAVAARPALAQLVFGDLRQNDLIVHVDHGIGQYQGLVKLTLEGTTGDFLLITYRDGDKLYLPVERMDLIQKYMGVDGVVPVLDKMGGASWDKVKAKVKKSVEKIAGELLKLYAARQVAGGHAFRENDELIKDFEGGFPYEETQDQRQAIDEVIGDMEKPEPMDRLVCGDVGYGKTEVALRAAFKAVMNAKQVAVLVPTTVLAEQHFKTFSQRFERYPVAVACLNRFRAPAVQREVIAGLATGKIDVVIGTHRLLQKDVTFKDLGLVVVDEEQRFGVRHKEKLKRLRTSVDVLTLTATPIPRTLHLSLTGVRDISVIATAPEDRLPITTYVCEYDETIITDAIERELKRGGQIFFIHNNVMSIDKMARRLQDLVPAVRLGVAHGQMEEQALEQVMLRFFNREIDMLVCTTIVESGLDVPSANTMIVNRADRFGLSQMYQLRGRVGRSDEKAYAYLFVAPEAALSKQAQKRLKVLMEHSDLGSGFQIAMSDLQIRGGGAILGASQSGHIAAVGYDMFLKLMEEAVAQIKGEEVAAPLNPEIQIPLSAFIPETYVQDIDQRLAIYRRLAKIGEIEQLADVKAELTDRYGSLPEEAAHLLVKIMLKVLCLKAGVARLDANGPRLNLTFSPLHMPDPGVLVAMVKASPQRFRLSPDHVLTLRFVETNAGSWLAQTKTVLKDIIRHAT